MLVEVDGCVYDKEQLARSHGHGDLDPVAREAFVNHVHIGGPERSKRAEEIIAHWSAEFRSRWPGLVFRIYRQVDRDEVVVRFHTVRDGVPNWAEEGVEIIEVKA